MGSVYSVGQVSSYIRNMFEQDYLLKRISIRGEISNCKYHTSGHIYFTLKDESAAMAGVMFAGNRRNLNFTLKNGQKVVVDGQVTVYERDGKYQVYAREIRLDGMGELYRQYLLLKEELDERGMFAEEYKQPIPKFALKIGIVTAPTGAAIQDMIQISRRRNPYVQLILYPALVQGAGAAPSIVRGIQKLDRMGLDCLIVGRGGGSIEDLWAFNEEMVAQAIFDCRTPVISAVGHETDFTIADFVADMRAPTPSAAAELAVFEYERFQAELSGFRERLRWQLFSQLESRRALLLQSERQLKLLHPRNRLMEYVRQTREWEEWLKRGLIDKLKDSRHRLLVYSTRLEGLSPLARLGGGYVYASTQDGLPLTSTAQIRPSDSLKLRLKDGTVTARAEKIESDLVDRGGEG